MKELTRNGNSLTEMMHFYTLHELMKMRIMERGISRVIPEQSVLIEKDGTREGRFDFLVELADGKRLGIEVLTRPSKGKMKEKLPYAGRVDEFVFVLPEGAMNFYRKKNRGPHRAQKPKFFPADFQNQKLQAWLFDLGKRRFSEKNRFGSVFNVWNRR